MLGCVMHSTGRDQKGFPRSARAAPFPYLLHHHGSFQEISDFIAGMGVAADRGSRLKFGDCGDRFATRHGHVELLKNGALDPRLLRSGP